MLILALHILFARNFHVLSKYGLNLFVYLRRVGQLKIEEPVIGSGKGGADETTRLVLLIWQCM